MHAPAAVPRTNHICRLQSGVGSLMCIEQNCRCALCNHRRGTGREGKGESRRITVKTFPCFLLSARVSPLSCLASSNWMCDRFSLFYSSSNFLPHTPPTSSLHHQHVFFCHCFVAVFFFFPLSFSLHSVSSLNPGGLALSDR